MFHDPPWDKSLVVRWPRPSVCGVTSPDEIITPLPAISLHAPKKLFLLIPADEKSSTSALRDNLGSFVELL